MAILFMSLTYSQVTIGTANDGGTFESPPLTSYYGFSYGQSIYLASEVNANGNITSVAFQLIAGADMSDADEMVDVWIGHTTKTSFTSTTDWVDIANLTQVLTNGTITVASDILTITFSAPFAYNGIDNLIIAVDANESGFGGTGDRISATDGPTTNLSIIYRSDNINPNPTVPSTASALFQSRGNITFNGITETCPNPLTLTVSNLAETSADLGWTVGGTETMWNVEWGVAGFTQGTGTTVVTATNSYSLTGLTADSSYAFYVQSDCGTGDLSSWIGPFSFTTPCPIFTAPYSQNFDTFKVDSSAFTYENCWSGTNIGSYLWEVAATTDTSSANTGPGSGISNGNYLFTESSSGATADAIDLVSPLIDLSALTTPSLTFDYHMFGANMGTLEVIVSQGGTDTTAFTLTGQQQTTETTTFTTQIVDLSAYANQTVQINFKGIRGSGITSDMAIDTVIIDELPTCINPSPLIASNIMDDSVDINWTAVSGSTGYNYEYGISPYVQGGGGTTGSTASNMVSLTNLTESKTYDFYVQNNCGSTFVKVTFTTPATPPVNDECANAVALLTINADFNCGVVTSGTTLGATASPQPDDATGTPNNDVWYTFVATGAQHQVSLLNIIAVTGSSTDMAMSVFNDAAGCNMVAANEIAESDPDSVILNGLTAGDTYYVRVYGWASSSTSQTTFDICIGTTPPPPANDECANAVGLTINTDLSCSNVTSGTTAGATASPQPDDATGTPNNDVWYTFVATGALHRVSLLNIIAVTGSSTDMGMSVFNDVAGCNMVAANEVGESDPNTLDLTGLTAGNTYYVRVYGWSSSNSAQTNYSICIGTPPPPPTNDDCAQAISLTPGSVFGTNPVDGTVVSATEGTESNDCGSNGPGVWYSVVVPSDGNITIETGPDALTGDTGFDSVIEAFSGTCGALTSIECDDDGAAGNLFSILDLTGLTAGSTIYIRVWESGGNQDEPFSISAYNATLSISNNVIEGFSMFPNPVTDILKFNALDKIQTISVYNLLGQEVIRTSPNTLNTELSMAILQTGVYLVKVNIGSQLGTYRILKE